MMCGGKIPHLVAVSSCGGKGAGKNQAQTTVIAGMVVSERCSLIEGIIGAAFHLPIRDVPGKTLLVYQDQMMVMLCVALPLEGIVLGTVTGWWK
jgi:hypothetical protein